ncbi:MAG: DsbA family protein [Candidatus Nanosalina sp.]
MELRKNLPDEIQVSFSKVATAVLLLGLGVGFSLGITASSLDYSLSLPELEVEEPRENTNDRKRVEENDKSGPIKTFAKLAGKAGADVSEFKSCYINGSRKEQREDYMRINKAVDSLGTPAFFIGNHRIGFEKISGAKPLKEGSRMQKTIEEQIAESNSGEKEIESDELALRSIKLKGEPDKGNASVKVVEYSDYGCPFCSEWAGFEAIPDRKFAADNKDWMKKLESNYVESGKVELIFKDYPVSQLHPNALKAHKAANCILEQSESMYWDYHDLLYRNQDDWKKK